MKLVLIQGNAIARYVGRQQELVITTDHWDFDVPVFIEDLRARGKEALA